MADENGALNQDAGSSPVPAQVGELVSTVEFHAPSKPAEADKTPEGALNTEPTEKTATKGKEREGGKTGEDGKEKPEGDAGRFDKHPRFQELHQRVKESDARIAKLEQELAAARKATSPGSNKDGAGELPYRDISKMKPEEILDWQSEDPQGYYANILAQAKHELSNEFSQQNEQRAAEDAVVATLENFAKENPDFDEMWDTGTLQEFVKTHPGHNAISAYYALTADAKLRAATEKAAKEAEAKFVKNQRAKRVADVLPQGPSAPGNLGGDDMLKDTRKFGGSTAVLAQRLSERRRAQAGM